ncbi:glycoside hydrolase family 2 protein [Agromyces sp. CFH 90414]|uniref:beta-mannosidase n=1 Tax=Agromyces agglutinans TaxID=2662258 RepID=A0A6I2F5P0_9MICO|nr:glycoside hydrolase family 2 protein [Agromyces agglutinans]
MPLSRRDLHDGWRLRAAAGPVPAALADALSGDATGAAVPATVPGCVHTDLLAADLIPDPYLDDHESLLAWIGQVDWTYETTFDWRPDGHERHDLVFDGLDTVATVRLNGRVVLEAANQHRSYRVDVRDVLAEGENTLEVAFRSPVRYANAQSLEFGARPRPYPLPYEAIRKSACNFGWDWGIATYTSGIWRPVRLESWSTARLAEARVVATPDGDGGTIDVDVTIEWATDAASAGAGATDAVARAPFVSVAVAGPGLGDGPLPSAMDDVEGDRARVTLALPKAERWWPVGHGGQPRYVVDVRLHGDGPHTLDATHRVVGFRTVRWDTEPDAEGTPFTLVVNDRPIFVKGVNWIPDDALPVRVDRARYERRLRQAVAANLNLVRVWGGGIYESEDFYDLCDELGLLTWQDFLFACAAYPEEEPLRSEVEAEAREQIVRLASHPSLVLLTGNNENLWGYEDWGWKQYLDGKTWGAYYYHDLFPRLVAELATHVPYSPGSPFSPNGEHPNAEPHGTMHLWEQWNRQDWLTYHDHRPRFVAEFGWQGPPAWSTLVRSVSDDPLTPESPGMIVHQKAMEGNVKLTNGLLPHFRVPADMETWHWAMQLNQANAVRFALEHFRSWAPHTMGAVVWQLNDCWPVTSWAAIDGDERLKPLWHGIRAAFAPRVVSVQPRDGGLAAVIGNDTDAPWPGELVVRRLSFDGAVLAERSVPFEVEPYGNATVAIAADIATPGDASAELVTATVAASGERGLWFFAEPRDSRLESARLSVETAPADGGTAVLVTAGNLVRDLCLLVDKLRVDKLLDPAVGSGESGGLVDKSTAVGEAYTEDGLVTLLPGETARFLVRHGGDAGTLDAAALADQRVLRSANQLVAG